MQKVIISYENLKYYLNIKIFMALDTMDGNWAEPS